MDKKVYNLTNPQKNIWNIEKYYSGTSINNVGGSVYFKCPMDISVLQQAVANVIANVDIFKLNFKIEGENIIQFFTDSQEQYIPEIIELNSLSQLYPIEEQMCQTPFAFESNNLFNCKIFKFSDNTAATVLIIHHIISDSWTVGLFCKQIVQEYLNLTNSTNPIQYKYSYSDFIEKEQAYLSSPACENDKKYWDTVYETVPETATIPGSIKKISSKISSIADRQSYNISRDVIEQISIFCKDNRISIYNFLVSIFSIYIGRVSNLDDFVIGTPILNRLNFADKQTSGMFVSTIPLRISIPNNSSFIDFSKTIAQNCMSMLRHQKYPYQNILEDIRKVDSTVPNLYNIVLSYQITDTQNKDIDCETHWIFNGNSADDLQIHVTDYNNTGSLNILYDYKTSKYSKKDISDIHARICHIIEQILANNNILLNDIDIVTEKEKHQLLYEFNDTASDYPRDKTIIELFEEQVNKVPDNIAVVFEGKSLTYKELNEKANQLARYLIKNNIKKGEIVGICLDKSLELIVGILAILKAGCIYLPLDVNYPESRISFILNDTNSKNILVNSNFPYTLDASVKLIDININNNSYSDMTKENLLLKRLPTDEAHILYTSGSTGKPKGVMIENIGIIRLVKNTNYINFTHTDKVLQAGSIVFDASTFEIWGALLNGSSLFIIKKENLLNANILKEYINHNHISIALLTSALFSKLCEDDPSIFNSLKYLLIGGDVLSPKHLNKARRFNPSLKIINAYGPTENSVISSCFTVDKNYSTSVPIGKPISNSTAYIVSRSGNLQPVNTPGELWVGGDGVSKGYLNNEKLNNEKFCYNVFNNSKIYKTGDLAEWLPNGNINFIGRMDNQVKVRGFRIELDEINNRILDYPNIRESFTTILTNDTQKDICSYIVLNGNIDIFSLKQHLKNTLPIYMIPKYITVLDKLPLNVNGKVNKNLLPTPSMQMEENAEIVSPRNDIDNILLNIIKNYLHIDNVNLNNSFLEIGGDSLSAISVISSVRKELSVELSISDLLGNYTIKDLSDHIVELLNSTSVLSNAISKAPIQDLYPLSSAQKRIYYSHKMIGDSNLVYNAPGAILIDALLDKEKVQQAFKKIIQNQSSFRTIFVSDGEEIKQQILDTVDFNVDISYNTEKNINDILKTFSKPFDLEKAPLLRVSLCYIDNKKTLLLLDSHHIIMDGVSLEILIRDFFNAYNQHSLNKLPLEYKDYSVYEKEFFKSDTIKQSEKYWLNRFKNFDFESLNLPYDYTLPANRGYIGNKIYNTIEPTLFDKVNNFAKEMQVSPYIVFLTSLFITLYKYTGQPDIVIGSPVANRTIPETKDIIGMFVNNIAIRAKVPTNKTVYTFLQKLKKIVAEDLENQSYPYDLLVKKLQVPVDNSKNPLFDIVLTYQNQQNNKNYKIIPVNTNTAKFNITLEIEPQSNNINIEYRTDIFKEETINSFIAHYMFVLDQLLNDANCKIDDINIITPKEQLLLNKFNDTNGPINRAPVSKIFEEQAVLHADDIAVICDDKFLTYKELNEKANSLAHHLIEKGVKPNDIVAIMTNRSLETIVCMIAILKAGAAFLNIDPTYPIERTEYYINDSKIERVLIQKSLKDKVSQIKNSIEIDLDNSKIYSKNTHNPDVQVKETDLSYIIYTSGSTGTPKGVMLNQIGMSNMVQAMTRVLDYLKEGNKHAIASVTSTPFDIFVYEIIVSLTHGLRVVMANNAEHRNPKLLDALIKKYDVDVMTVTPSLMKINYDNREPDTALARVKNMVFGGEPLPEKFVQDLRALADDITIYNIYGPSEITILSNVQNLNGEKEITIGPPILNTQIYILDKNMKQVPIGVIGEIYIGGIQVGDGYIGKAEMTAEKFLKNPFGPGKIYKSGDIGRWTFDGKVQCLGRIDNQVKLRGLRIELSEIENEILKMDGVTSAIVNKIVLDNQEFLCAYYVADTDISETTVKETLRKFLPQYMVPTYVMKLETMPYTINRKIDRKALPLPETHKMVSSPHVNIATLDSNEEKLLQIWKNLLKIDNIDVNDNFFDIGGDSILAINMQIEALKYGLELEYADIFNYPTVRQLSQKLPSPVENFMSNYDYTQINDLLSRNNINNLNKIEKYNVGNILLIGATGYLGAHILYSFLEQETGISYCLIRPKDGESPKDRLMARLKFYFGDNIKKYESRIKVISGDIVKTNIGLSEADYKEISQNINVVVNAGALVKHFGLKKLFEDINVTGTKNVVAFCKQNNKRLIHISTISISGFGEKEDSIATIDKNDMKDFTERNLYIGQNIKGIYTTTKYKAEISVLEAIEDGLDAQILRVGNVTNRYSDGVFQKNFDDNAFARRIKSFIEIGAFPQYMLEHEIEFTPVDLCADSIVKILQYDSPCNVFHIFDTKLIAVKTFLTALKRTNIEMLAVSDKMMTYIITGILADDENKHLISGIVQDLDSDKHLVYTSRIKLDATFTEQYLNRIGFDWDSIDSDYIIKCINYFKKIKFIE